MSIPLELVFHDLDRSAAVEAAARDHLAKLEHLAPGITSCRVTIEARARSHRVVLFAVRVEVRHTGVETVATRPPRVGHEHEDVYAALHNAFRAVQRRLQDRQRPRRSDVKHHTVVS